MKTCKKCGISKPLEAYPKSTRTNDGHLGSCQVCRNAYAVAWRARDPEKHRATRAEWRTKNPNKNIEYYDNYLSREGKARRIPKTPEEIRLRQNEYNKKWEKQDRKKHPEKYKTTPRQLEWQRIDRLMHPEKYRMYSKTYYDRDPKKHRAKSAAWYKANKELVAEKNIVYNRNRVDKLKDHYVISLIKGKGGKLTDIPKALIEVKRLEILIKRRVKNENSNDTKK